MLIGVGLRVRLSPGTQHDHHPLISPALAPPSHGVTPTSPLQGSSRSLVQTQSRSEPRCLAQGTKGTITVMHL